MPAMMPLRYGSEVEKAADWYIWVSNVFRGKSVPAERAGTMIQHSPRQHRREAIQVMLVTRTTQNMFGSLYDGRTLRNLCVYEMIPLVRSVPRKEAARIA